MTTSERPINRQTRLFLGSLIVLSLLVEYTWFRAPTPENELPRFLLQYGRMIPFFVLVAQITPQRWIHVLLGVIWLGLTLAAWPR